MNKSVLRQSDIGIAKHQKGVQAFASYKTSAATPFDAAAGLAALTKHGIGLVTACIISNLSAVVGWDFRRVLRLVKNLGSGVLRWGLDPMDGRKMLISEVMMERK